MIILCVLVYNLIHIGWRLINTQYALVTFFHGMGLIIYAKYKNVIWWRLKSIGSHSFMSHTWLLCKIPILLSRTYIHINSPLKKNFLALTLLPSSHCVSVKVNSIFSPIRMIRAIQGPSQYKFIILGQNQKMLTETVIKPGLVWDENPRLITILEVLNVEFPQNFTTLGHRVIISGFLMNNLTKRNLKIRRKSSYLELEKINRRKAKGEFLVLFDTIRAPNEVLKNQINYE